MDSVLSVSVHCSLCQNFEYFCLFFTRLTEDLWSREKFLVLPLNPQNRRLFLGFGSVSIKKRLYTTSFCPSTPLRDPEWKVGFDWSAGKSLSTFISEFQCVWEMEWRSCVTGRRGTSERRPSLSRYTHQNGWSSGPPPVTTTYLNIRVSHFYPFCHKSTIGTCKHVLFVVELQLRTEEFLSCRDVSRDDFCCREDTSKITGRTTLDVGLGKDCPYTGPGGDWVSGTTTIPQPMENGIEKGVDNGFDVFYVKLPTLPWVTRWRGWWK